jgi:hypothetical protein
MLSVYLCPKVERKTERQKDRKTERQREREKETQREREKERQKHSRFPLALLERLDR